MPRFVILEHDHPILHWDLMLEAGEALQTWRFSAPPREGVAVGAERSFDHRLAYLEYEGPVSGGRGLVVRWDGGAFLWEEQTDGQVSVMLVGVRLHGRLRLQRTGECWSATFENGAGEGRGVRGPG